MDKELAAKLVEIIGGIQKTVAQAQDFAISQLPDIVSSYLLYGRVTTSLAFLCGIVLLVVTVWAGQKMTRAYEEAESIQYTIVALAAGGFSCTLLLFNTSNFFLVWLSPKIWLIQEFIKLIR